MRLPVRLVAVSLGAVLLFAAPAVAADHAPVRFWSVSKVEQGVGEVPVQSGAQVGGKLQQYARLGRSVFNLPLPAPYWYFLPRDSAFGSVFSDETGKQYSVLAQAPVPNPMRIGTPKGGIAHLDEYQAYEKRAGEASLRITISDLLLQTVDDNNRLGAWECPPQGECDPVRTVVRFHARAYAASAGGDFFQTGGVAYLKGHQHSWRPGAATSADAAKRLWGSDNFDTDGDADDSNTGAAGAMFTKKAIKVRVPLGSVRRGELFAVHVTLEAEAVDDRGGESAAQAFVQDPQQRGRPLLLTTHGVAARGKPRFKEPHATAVRPARCSRRPRHAGSIQLSARGYTANESESAPMVLLTRNGGAHGAASVTVTANAGTARAGHDFKRTSTTVRFADGDKGPRLVEVPLREDRGAEGAETFTLKLSNARCGKLGARHRATVTIVDDDVEPPPASTEPAHTFTVAGTVDGLQGTGLVLDDVGADLPVSANGRFTFPAARPAGATYDVKVKAQPHGPDQVCTVANGRGTVTANVTGVTVHCTTRATPLGLDATFGTGGRVSTPVSGGHGEAVVIQPAGGIVTAGWRTTPTGVDFALTRHDATGKLDDGFGTHGIRTTDVGGADDEAYDVALLPGGGIVAAGRSDGAFAVARYGPDGTPAGTTRTPVLDGGDQANAVAVQGDGKIVVAGYGTRSGIDGDVAVVRYNADGTPDEDFGAHGIATADLGTRSDDARAVVIQPSGKIVVAGVAGEDVALARFTASGDLDGTFGQGGRRITDFGSVDVANGVALTPGGDIVVAGYTLGPAINRDYLLARYSADGTFDTAVKTDVLGGDDFAENLVVDSVGRIVLVGRASSATISDLALVRYSADLVPDATFGDHGVVAADFHGSGEFGQDAALDAAGRIVAAGYTANGNGLEFALMRASP
jgi:uncharacterized delta-60 repeat protein